MISVPDLISVICPKDGPVLIGEEEREVVYAKNQPEYIPLRTLRGMNHEGRVLSRWTPTEEQRKAIAEGKDIFLVLLTFHGPLAPSMMLIGDDSNAQELRDLIGLPDSDKPAVNDRLESLRTAFEDGFVSTECEPKNSES